MIEKIKESINKFDLDLTGLNILTEASSGNYVITSVIAAIAGANVVAVTKESKYSSVQSVIEQTMALAKEFGVEKRITITEDKTSIKYNTFDIVTNTGFVRPIDTEVVSQLPTNCVIPLMWEPWEYRKEDLDLDACSSKGIKVYGTNESDKHLQTMTYIGYTVLSFLLSEKVTPFSAKILLLGDKHFSEAIKNILNANNYSYKHISEYNQQIDVSFYNVVVIAENEVENLLIGRDAFILDSDISDDTLIIHISGNVNFNNLRCKTIPEKPANFGYMSFTTDYIDNKAVIDLHTAGLKVAQGMLDANKLNLPPLEYKNYMETNYPALAFENERFW